MGSLLRHSLVITLTYTSTLLANSSLVVRRAMLALLAGRSSLTLMVVGVHMAVVHSLERIPPKWTVLLHTFAGKWQNPLSKAVSASVHWSNCRMLLESPSPYRCSLRPTALSTES